MSIKEISFALKFLLFLNLFPGYFEKYIFILPHSSFQVSIPEVKIQAMQLSKNMRTEINKIFQYKNQSFR